MPEVKKHISLKEDVEYCVKFIFNHDKDSEPVIQLNYEDIECSTQRITEYKFANCFSLHDFVILTHKPTGCEFKVEPGSVDIYFAVRWALIKLQERVDSKMREDVNPSTDDAASFLDKLMKGLKRN